MALMADFLMIAAALAAGFYCYVLSKRLAELQSAEGGVGQVVTALSVQVDELSHSVEQARRAANTSNDSLTELTARAEGVAQRLELMVASMHDIPANEAVSATVHTDENPIFVTRNTGGSGSKYES